MKKTLIAVVLTLCLLLSVTLVACQQQVTLTLYDNDGEKVLATVKVNKGEAPTKPADPTKDGMTFKGWFITPTNPKEFDFAAPLTEDAKAYAQWQAADYQDARDWVLVGTMNGWAAAKGYHFKKTEGKGNEYTLTVDIDLGASFKCTVLNADGVLDYNNATGANVGFAAMSNPGDYFEGVASLGDAPKDISCKLAGNYTFTLTTDAENANNSLKVVRNGDKVGPVEPDGPVMTYYIKGSKITDWKDFISDTTTMKESVNDENVYTLNIYLVAGDEFMFATLVTEDGETTEGTVYIRSTNLDEASKPLFDGTGNMTVKESGLYTFTYNTKSGYLSATVNKDSAPEAADYYIDGTFNPELQDWDYNFKAENKLVQDETKAHIYTIEHVHLLEGKEFIIQKFKAGATERGEWGTDSYNGLGSYNFKNVLSPGDKFEAVGTNGSQNIKINKTSDYKITLNTLSGMIVIEDENIPDDVYVNGNMTIVGDKQWQNVPEWKMTYNESTQTYTITKAFEVGNQFGLKVCVGNDSTQQRYWYNGSQAPDAVNGFTKDGNFVCTTAGTYTVTLDISGETPVITITAATAE